MITIDLIFSTGPQGEFGYDGGLWHLDPEDLRMFKQVRKNYKHILCGERTYKSLPQHVRDEHYFVVLDRTFGIDMFLSTLQGDYLCIGGAYVINHLLEKFAVGDPRFTIRTMFISKFPYQDKPYDTKVDLSYIDKDRFVKDFIVHIRPRENFILWAYENLFFVPNPIVNQVVNAKTDG